MHAVQYTGNRFSLADNLAYRGRFIACGSWFSSPLRLCTMGMSFHRIDREAVLRMLDRMIGLGGGVACLNRNDRFFPHLENGWSDAVRDVLREMPVDTWDYSQGESTARCVMKRSLQHHHSRLLRGTHSRPGYPVHR